MSRDIDKQLVKYLNDAHAMEMQSIELLEKGIELAGDTTLAQLFRGHLNDSRDHERYVKQRLEALDESPSTMKNIGAQAAAKGLGLLAQAMPDTPAKLMAVAFAFEHFEIASYKSLIVMAEAAGEPEIARTCQQILRQEEAMASWIGEHLEEITRQFMARAEAGDSAAKR